MSSIVLCLWGMSGFTFITLKLYHGGALLYESEEARYVGGLVSEYVDVDVDTISYFEIKDYIKELGYSPNCKFSIRPPNSCILGDIDNDDILLAMRNCLQNGAVVEVYVHMLKEESGAAFNKVGTTENRASENIEYNEVGEAAFNGVDVSLNTTSNIPSTSNTTAPYTNPSDSEDSDYSVKGSNESTEESDDSEDSELLEDDQYGSDVHDELIQLRAEKRSFLRRRKRRERIPADTEEVPCGNAGADLGFDETAINTNTLEGRLGGDEPYYASSDACSFETDTDDNCLEEGEKMRLKLLNTKRKKRTTDSVRFDPNSKKIVWQLGMVFESVKEFRLAVTKYAIQRRVQIEKCVKEPTRVRVRCCKVNCKWLLYASLDRKTNNFVIKTYMPIHLCQKASRNYLCNSKFIASVFKDKVIEQPNIRVFKLQELIRKKYNVHVGKTTTRRARAKILNEIMGDHVKEFGRILDYKDELLRSNPGSTCVVKLGEANESGRVVFEAFYICFAALKMAFMSARKCIGLDGCFLKGVCMGQLLIVVAKDGNNQMLPLAWAVVEKENTNSWSWFISLLQEDLGLGDGTNFTIMSDMQKGLDIAIKELLPACEERRCARHILANWSQNWKGLQRKKLFWKCARSTFEAEFRENLEELSKLGMGIVDDLIYYDKEYWCKVYFNCEVKSDAIDNNMCESFNAWILSARHKTIISMLEEIRTKVMTRLARLSEFPNSWIINFSPIMKVLEENIDKSMTCNIEFNGVTGYEVLDGYKQHTVCLRKRECSCRSWMLKGIPCAHALAAMLHRQYDPHDFIHLCYSKERYLMTYSHFIQPMNNMPMWPESRNNLVAPPVITKMPGRPRKLRRKEAGETKVTTKEVVIYEGVMELVLLSGNIELPLLQMLKNHQAHPLESWFTCSQGCTTQGVDQNTNVAPKETATTRKGKGVGNTTQFKRPRVTGMGVFQAENGFKTFNASIPGLPSSRILAGPKRVLRSNVVTGDVGFKPTSGLKWKGNQAITTIRLQQIRDQSRLSNPNASSSSQPRDPWKL
ncbi:hypothetical protein KY285_019699 [Solanum tuberosum]|nr:hypothetical protein KY285_019699 [Solanum tuberosum]